jgi:ribosomal protein S11
MYLKTFILKKNPLISINKVKYKFFLKKKFIYLILFLWLKIIKKNNFLMKSINLKKIGSTMSYILSIKTNKNFLSFFNHLTIYFKNYFKTNNLISYIIKITLLKSNICINITNVNGSILIACTSGLIKLKGSQKTKRFAYNRILKFTKFKIRKLTNKIFAIHFIGNNYKKKYILKSFKKYFYIQSIKHFNLISHNGCRLKKKK